MHWGIRRYQKKNGERTSLGKKHRGITDRNSSGIGKKLLKDAAITAGIAAAAYAYTVNKDAVDACVKKYANMALDKMGDTGTKIRKGKQYISEAFSSTKTAIGSSSKAIKDIHQAARSVKQVGKSAKNVVKDTIGFATEVGKHAANTTKKIVDDIQYEKWLKKNGGVVPGGEVKSFGSSLEKFVEPKKNSESFKVEGSSLEKFVEPKKTSKLKQAAKDAVYYKALNAKQAIVRRAHNNKDNVNPNVPGTSLEGFYERKKIKQPSGLEKYAKNTAAKYLGGTAIAAATKIAEKKISNKQKSKKKR